MAFTFCQVFKNKVENFNGLNLQHKSNILKQQATYLLTLDIEECSVKLYTWDRFFIEQYFDEEQQVTKINIVEDDGLVKYLKSISLSDLGYPTVI